MAKKEKNNNNALLNQSYWGGVFYRLKKNKRAMISLFILVGLVLACLLIPVLSRYSIEQTSPADGYLAPNSTFWLGTDKIGRDLFTRLFYAGRISLGVALTVTAVQCTVGIILGCLAGFYGGMVEAIIMRLAEVFMSFPLMMMAVTMVGLFGGSSVNVLIFTLTLLSWPNICRIVRGQILTLRELEYMEACEALGISDFKRIFKHLLPNVLAYIIVYATLGMANVLLVETSLSFLGLGVSPPTPTWGNMIQDARNLLIIQDKWWLWIPPGICIFTSVMCFNLLGDGLRDAIDPKMKT